MINQIKKRSGELVAFDPDKLNRWAEWAGGIGVDWSGVVLEASRKVFDGCTTDDLHQSLISACVDRETTAHLKMAGRLYIGAIYKKAFGDWRLIPSVDVMYHRMVQKGLWAKMDYSDAELGLADSFIDHELDLQATLTESKQVIDKYAIRDRVDGEVYETPQFVYMRMALGNMEKMPKDRRMQDVRNLYEMLAHKEINPPSPFSINLGTPKKQYASCCVTTTNDTIPSLAAADHIAYVMTAASAGIGSHIKTRSKGDKVRGGAIVHQGKLPYYRVQEKLVAANLQSSRGGANTMHFNVLDPELLDLLKLKNVQSVADKRIKDIDYSVGYNETFAQYVAKNKMWPLVSYGDAPLLYEMMYQGDAGMFEEELHAVLNNVLIPKTMVKARDIAVSFLTEAVENGRIYEHNTQEMNRHTPFIQQIYSSNLCQEIGLVSAGYRSVADLYETDLEELEAVDGEIGLCSLAAINATVSEHRYDQVAYYAALMIDNVIDIMEYPFPQLGYTARARRSIGVGITNLAYAMAKQGLKYSTLEGKQWIYYHAERHSLALHRASVRLAKERGRCDWYDLTRYSDGWLPVDTANKAIQEKLGVLPSIKWEGIRLDIEEHGVRFSVLEAHMPCESSSAASGHTNGLYPIRSGKVVKTSGTNKNLFIAPEWETLKSQYELAWNVPTIDLIDCYAAVQCFTGQAISADLYIRYNSDGKREISSKQLLEEWLYRVKMGLKTRYYINSSTGVDISTMSEPSTMEEEEPDCESCSL